MVVGLRRSCRSLPVSASLYGDSLQFLGRFVKVSGGCWAAGRDGDRQTLAQNAFFVV